MLYIHAMYSDKNKNITTNLTLSNLITVKIFQYELVKQNQNKALVGKQRKPNYQQKAGISRKAQQKGAQCYHKKHNINATHEN